MPLSPSLQRSLKRFVPASLAARTSLLLIVGFALLEIAGLTVETLDRMSFDNRLSARQASVHAVMTYRSVVEVPPEERSTEVAHLELPTGWSVKLSDRPDGDMTREVPFSEFHSLIFMGPPFPSDHPGNGPPFPGPHEPFQPDGGQKGPFHFPGMGGGPDHGLPRLGAHEGPHEGPRDGMEDLSGSPNCAFPSPDPRCGRGRDALRQAMLAPHWRPQQIMTFHKEKGRKRGLAFLLPADTRWLVIRYTLPVASPFTSPTFPLALGLMTAGGCVLIIWGVRRLIAPVGTLAAAAEALAPDEGCSPLPEDGPLEIARAAAAFNAMAARIRRFVSERTHILTAIGHDLRTPITRLKLRAEFIEDDEMREKFLYDLNELSAMVEATLAFGRDSSNREKVSPVDLSALLQTVVDDVVESHPDMEDRIVLTGDPDPVILRGRPLALKRAFMNLVINAANYGGCARVTLDEPQNGYVTVRIEDDGPGLPDADLERMFEPFVRGEASRNRETGGSGLGLAIVRTIIRGQGGDVVLRNRTPHGLTAIVTLVA